MSNIKKTTHIIESTDVNKILSSIGVDVFMDDLIARLTKALHTFNSEHTVIPARSGFHYTFPFTGLVEWMPLHARGEEITIKLVGYHPGNPELFDTPTILSSVYKFDTRTGHLMAVMDGVLSTALRTGAISAVATKIMARPDSKVLGIIGCGAQAVTQIHAISRVLDIDTVLYYDIDDAAGDSLAERIKPLGLNLKLESKSIPEIVKESDVLCTATSIDIGQGPLFESLETKPHLHINAVGSDFPGKIEIPLKLLRESVVIPDFKDQAVVEGECQQLTAAEIGPDLSAIARQEDKYDYIQNRVSVFDSTGWALEDHVVMDLIIESAQKLKLGKHLEVEYFPEDNKNPYEFLQMNSKAPISIKESVKTDKH